MRKLYIVKTHEQFDEIIKKGQFKKNSSFIIYYQSNDLPYDRYGISVGTKLGHAVFRNSYKRKIRNIADNYKKNYNNSQDYIIILRKGALEKTYTDLESDFNKLMLNIRKDITNEKQN